MNDIEYLVISSSIDYSTDLVCFELYERKKQYLRLNRDMFGEYDIIFSLQDRKMTIKMGGDLYTIRNNSLKGVFFRAPVVSVKSGSVLTVKNPQTAKTELAACG